MKSRILSFLDDVRSSYWFVPMVMVVAAIILSFAALKIDTFLSQTSPEWLKWLFDNQPEGAREVLSTIAGSMITVAGVVFSITLVTVSNAAFRLSPRLLTNFMRDVSNQVTLGTFISTFIYCLLVLRAVQSAPPGQTGDEAAAFVPHLAILLGLIMAVCSIAVLIWFIHHIPRAIHVSALVAQVSNELDEQLKEKCVDQKAETVSPGDIAAFTSRLKSNASGVKVINSPVSGYIRIIEKSELVSLGCKHDLEVQLVCKPGDYLSEGDPLLRYREVSGVENAEEVASKLKACFFLGTMRTPVQDSEFLFQELSEIAMRALSPGINDPVSAITALNRIVSGLIIVGENKDVSPASFDEDGRLRLISPETRFDALVFGNLDMMAPDFARSMPAAVEFLERLERMKTRLEGPNRKIISQVETRFREQVKTALDETSARLVLKVQDDVQGEAPKSAGRKIRSLFSF